MSRVPNGSYCSDISIILFTLIVRGSGLLRCKDSLEAQYLFNKGQYSYKTILGERRIVAHAYGLKSISCGKDLVNFKTLFSTVSEGYKQCKYAS